MFTLTFTEPDGGKPQSHPLSNGELLIGRDAGCDVVLRSKDVSRRHARFFVKGGELLVEDLGSHNGVYVKGARVEKPAKVDPGAAVEIGDVKVAIKAASEAVGAGAVLRGLQNEIRLPAKAAVGRGADCDVVLDDDSVSRRHAELARDERGAYRLRDLESANGTFLDGKPIGREPVLVPEGARLRFGDVELTFLRQQPGLTKAARQKILVAVLGVAIIAVAMLIVARPQKRQEEPEPEDRSGALVDQAQAAIESERFDDAARLAQEAIDQDPVAPAPRKLLAQARSEQQSQRVFADALAKAQVGREDDSLQLLAQVPPQSRFFARARIKAKDLATAVLRAHGPACRTAPRDNALEVADQCARALDVKCQTAAVDDDPMLKALRAAEKRLPRRVPWSCPPQLAALFHDDAATAEAAPVDEKALAGLYLDATVRGAVAQYARGDASGALRALSKGDRKPGAVEAIEKMKIVDGRFREGQTAMMGGALDRADAIFREALQADAALLPAGAESFFGRQMRASLARAHGKAGDDRLQRMQYASAYDEWMKGLAFSPKDPHLLDQVARMEKVAENLLSQSPSCDQLNVAAHITRADPPSPAHEAALQSLARCR